MNLPDVYNVRDRMARSREIARRSGLFADGKTESSDRSGRNDFNPGPRQTSRENPRNSLGTDKAPPIQPVLETCV